jgi:hypothetical protein
MNPDVEIEIVEKVVMESNIESRIPEYDTIAMPSITRKETSA